MIYVQIDREKQTSNISGFHVTGHAGYAEAGRDIVCAGVSAVTVGAVNALERLLSVQMEARMEKGDLSAVMPSSITGENEEKAQLILESMLVMLRSIEDSYADYVKITETSQ